MTNRAPRSTKEVIAGTLRALGESLIELANQVDRDEIQPVRLAQLTAEIVECLAGARREWFGAAS